MKRKTISVIAIIAFLNYLNAGCSPKKEVKILNEEFDSSIYRTDIVYVVLQNGKAYRFSPPARFKKSPNLVNGMNIVGEKMSISLEQRELEEIRISRPQTISLDAITGMSISEILFKDNRIQKAEEGLWFFNRVENKLVLMKDNQPVQEIDGGSIKEVRVSAPKLLTKNEILQQPNTYVREIVLGDKVHTFADPGGTLDKSKYVLSGITLLGNTLSIPEQDILYVNVSRVDAAGAFFATIGVLVLIVGIIFIIALATKQSCPFVYSYNGDQYVFDAEPLGGAVARGLEKTDYSRLEHLRETKGKYQLVFRNEVRETQYLDEIKLLIIDHDKETTVIPDEKGTFFQLSIPATAIRSYTESGQDLTPFLRENDEIAWQTYLPRGDTSRFHANRHQLTLNFLKPKVVTNANLIFNGGTAAWGSNMIRKMLELRGDQLDKWYAGIDRQGPEYEELFHFILREELYLLKIHLKNNDQWLYGGIIPGGGPLITEDRVIPLDLSKIEGDTLTIRLNPPKGFWQINYLALDYNPHMHDISYEIPLHYAIDHRDSIVTSILSSADDVYHQMPEVGDWFIAEFRAPDKQPNKVRSIFLKTKGYYELHIDKTKPEQTELIKKLIANPGDIIRYSMERYYEWYQQQIASN